MSRSLEQRAERVRSRAAVRAWEYRQRNHAKGTWFRLRRLLADAARAYVVPEAEAHALEAEGFRPEPVGAALEPPKVMLVVPEARVASLPGKREIPVRLDAELLAARWLVLVPFDADCGSLP